MEPKRQNRLGPTVLHGRLRERWQRRMERLSAGTLWLHLFLLIVGLTAGRTAGSALFLERYDESGLALLYVWVGGSLFLGYGLLHWLTRGRKGVRLAQGVVLAQGLGIMALSCLLSPAGRGQTSNWSGLLCFWLELCSFLTTLQFWTLTNQLFPSTRAKYWYAWIGTGGILGSIVGGGLTCWLGSTGLLVLAACVTLPVLGLLEIFYRLGLTWGKMNPDQERLRRPADILLAANPERRRLGLQPDRMGGQVANLTYEGETADLAWRQVALPLALLTLLTVFTTTLGDFYFKSFADQTHGGHAGRLTRFFGNYYLIVGLTTLVIQLTGTFWLLRRSYTFAGLLMLPLTLGCTGLANILWPSLLLATLLRISDSTLSHSINRSCREVLYAQLTRIRRSDLQELCDGFAGRLGLVLAGLVLWFITALLPGWSGTAYLFFFCFCVFAWLLTLVWLRQMCSAAPLPPSAPSTQPLYFRIPVDLHARSTRMFPQLPEAPVLNVEGTSNP